MKSWPRDWMENWLVRLNGCVVRGSVPPIAVRSPLHSYTAYMCQPETAWQGGSGVMGISHLWHSLRICHTFYIGNTLLSELFTISCFKWFILLEMIIFLVLIFLLCSNCLKLLKGVSIILCVSISKLSAFCQKMETYSNPSRDWHDQHKCFHSITTSRYPLEVGIQWITIL